MTGDGGVLAADEAQVLAWVWGFGVGRRRGRGRGRWCVCVSGRGSESQLGGQAALATEQVTTRGFSRRRWEFRSTSLGGAHAPLTVASTESTMDGLRAERVARGSQRVEFMRRNTAAAPGLESINPSSGSGRTSDSEGGAQWVLKGRRRRAPCRGLGGLGRHS